MAMSQDGNPPTPDRDVGGDARETLSRYEALCDFYPLFNELTKSGEEDFVLRLALIGEMVARPRQFWRYDDLEREFTWIETDKRNYLLRSLRESGWLAQDPYLGYQLTEVAQVICNFIAFLRSLQPAGDSLGLALMGVEYYLAHNRDPLPLIAGIRLRLAQLVDRVGAALSSRSPAVIMRTRDYLEASLAYSEKMRKVLHATDYDSPRALQEASRAHQLLSLLHDYRSELNRLVAEMGRQMLTLSGGVTQERVAAAFLGMPLGDLAQLARAYVRPPLPMAAYVIPDILVSVAEAFLSRDKAGNDEVEPWGPVVEVRAELVPRPGNQNLEDYVSELASLAAYPEPVAIESFVPKGNRASSFLRLHLLSLLRPPGKPVARRDTAIGRLVRLLLRLETGEGEVAVGRAGVAEMTPGTIGKAKPPLSSHRGTEAGVDTGEGEANADGS